MRRVFVDPEFPQRDAIQEAAKWIVNGGVIALPTDTLYGLGADPYSAAAVARVFAVKGRAAERALPLIAADAAQVATHLGRLDAVAQLLADRFWPGPLTLLLPAPAALAVDVTGGAGQGGGRGPPRAAGPAVFAAAGEAVTAAPAHPSGGAGPAGPAPGGRAPRGRARP